MHHRIFAALRSLRQDLAARLDDAVHRCVGRLKEWRRVGTRYEKLAGSYLASVHAAAIGIYLRELIRLSVPPRPDQDVPERTA